jgi:hypothetical protein
MARPDRALVRSRQPTFQQGCYPMNGWHHDMGGVWTGREDSRLPAISELGELIVSPPAVGVHDGAQLDRSSDERPEALPADIGNAAQPNPPEASGHGNLHGDHHDGLPLRLPAVYPCLKATDVGFYEAAEPLPRWSNHGASHLVEPRPRGLIAAKPQDTLKPQRAGTELLVGHMPHRQEPQPAGCLGTLENRAGRRRSLALTSCAPRLTSASRPSLLAPTCGTAEPIAPSQTP